MKNRSILLQLDEPKISSKTMIAFSYSLRGSLSSPTSFILILELEYCSGGDLVIIQTSLTHSRENFQHKISFTRKRWTYNECSNVGLLL